MLHKGQSALEYLLTYGVTMLIVVIVGGALYNSGVFSPGRQPQILYFSQFQVLDHVMNANGSLYMNIGIRSSDPVRVERIIANCSGSSNYSLYSEILSGKDKKFFVVYGLDPYDDFYECDITIHYTRLDSTISHSDFGFISGYISNAYWGENDTAPLYIYDLSLPETAIDGENVTVSWFTNLDSNGTVYYSVNNGSWVNASHSSLYHSVNIGPFTAGDVIEFYIKSCTPEGECVISDNSSLNYFLDIVNETGNDSIEPDVGNITHYPITPNTTSSVTITGSASDSESNITSCRIRIDNSSTWEVMSASDGTYDEPVENVTYTFDPLLSGNHTIYITCNDSFDNWIIPPNEYLFSVIDSGGVPPSEQLGISMYQAFGIGQNNTTGEVLLKFPGAYSQARTTLDITRINGTIPSNSTVRVQYTGGMGGIQYMTDNSDRTWSVVEPSGPSGCVGYRIWVNQYKAPYWPTYKSFKSSGGRDFVKGAFLVGSYTNKYQPIYINATIIDSGGVNSDPYVVDWCSNEEFKLKLDIYNASSEKINVDSAEISARLVRRATSWYDWGSESFKELNSNKYLNKVGGSFEHTFPIKSIIGNNPDSKTTLLLSIESGCQYKPVRVAVELTVESDC